MTKTILVTTDFSAPSQTAAHFAMYLANTMKAQMAFRAQVISVSAIDDIHHAFGIDY